MQTTTRLSLTPSRNGHKAPSKARKPSRKPYTRSELGRVAAFACVALSGLAVSLPHLAAEVGTLTGAGALAAWALALTIDAGMCVTKCHLGARGNNRIVAWAVIGACTLLSCVLNAHAFTTHAATTFGTVMGTVFGVFLPLFVVAASYLATGILSRHAD